VEPDDGALTMTQGSHAALLVVDMLNDFLTGPFAGPGAERLIGPVRTAVDRARARGVPVIFICDAHSPNDDEFAVLPPHAIAGTHGAEIVDELAPQPGETIVKKHRYSGFFETELTDLLRDLRVDTIAFCGLQTDCCVMHTAADGFFRGFRPVILEDAVTARTEDGHRHAMASMQRLYGAQVVASDKFFSLGATQ
jgi:nicotinamidase/pyrazinamidase